MDGRCAAIAFAFKSQVHFFSLEFRMKYRCRLALKACLIKIFCLFIYLVFAFIGGVYISGILAMLSTASLAIFVVLSVIQLAMITSRDTVVLKYKTCVILKLALSIIAGMSTN